MDVLAGMFGSLTAGKNGERRAPGRLVSGDDKRKIMAIYDIMTSNIQSPEIIKQLKAIKDGSGSRRLVHVQNLAF